MENFSDLKAKLLTSDSVKALILESNTYNQLKKNGWKVEQSPYFKDSKTNKLRELDVKARIFFYKEEYSCDVDLLVECKSLKNYHIIASNKNTSKNDFNFMWVGNYIDNEINKLDELFFKHNFSTDEIKYIKEKLYKYCVPETTFRWIDFKLSPINIPTFNAYKETNINSTKDLDNSVIWKCIMSLESAISAHEDFLLNKIEYSIIEALHEENYRIKIIENLILKIIQSSNHIFFIHPIIVVESNLWEFNNSHELIKQKYFRINIQHFFGYNFWVDIVNNNHLDEYIIKTKKYIEFHKERKFNIY